MLSALYTDSGTRFTVIAIESEDLVRKKQILAIVGSLVIAAIVCAGILALTMGTSSDMFWPTLATSIMVVAIITMLTQKTQKKE